MQNKIQWASAKDLDASLEINQKVVGPDQNRSAQISKAVRERRCRVLISNSRITGFMISSPRSFKEMDFLNLLVVDPEYRRKGIASSLIDQFRADSTTAECWTSTNASNQDMLKLLENLSWAESEYSEELDPGDPDVFFFTHKEL